MTRRSYLPELILSDSERTELKRLTRRRKTAQALALRARIILLCADGETHLNIADKLGVSNVTVGKWRRRFIDKRLDGLLDEPRPGQPRKITDEDVERVWW